jgi:6-phosphogluconate dehydrogenase
MKIGFAGLGKMGSRMVRKLLLLGHELVIWNRSPGPGEILLEESRNLETGKGNNCRLSIAPVLKDLVNNLARPRVIWIMLPAGEPTRNILEVLSQLLEPDDILIDGGNSYYKDTDIRYNELNKRGIKFLGIGVSGGIIAEKQGYPLMVGGDTTAYRYIEPILESLAWEHGGCSYFGTGGAGHFVKMVHNGIEYGIMQSLGEGFAVLEKAPYQLDLAKIARLYQKGTLVSGFMLDRAVEVLETNPTLNNVKGIVVESGEARWMVEQAPEEGVEVDLIKMALDYRRRSSTDVKIQNTFTARFIASLRNAFGGHEIQINQS